MTRMITDPSELDALPAWAVVEDVLGVAWVRHPGTPDRADHWVSYYGDRMSAQRVAADGPLTVLHHPEGDAVPTITTTAEQQTEDPVNLALQETVYKAYSEWRSNGRDPMYICADIIEAIEDRFDLSEKEKP